jgi:uncharacterized protein YggE
MKRFLSLLIAGVLLVGALSACTASPVKVTTSPSVPSLNATGEGKVYIAPDIAYINIGVHTEASEVSTAMSDNSAQAQSVSDALQALGVEAKDIQTTNFSIYPITSYDNNGQMTGTHYAVDNSVYVTVRDLAQLGNLLDAVVSSGANTINGISFDIQDKAAATAQARDMAIEDAKAEAAAIAKTAGVSLGDLQSISISENGTINPVYEGKGGAMYSSNVEAPVSAGQLMISVNAYLTYAIH